MSVKVHEPVCEDSAQDLYFWFDHFLGDQIKDEWATAVVGGGTIAVVDAQTGGIIRLNVPTNATGDEATIDWGAIRSLLVSKKVTMEVRMKLNSIANITANILLRFTGANRIYFRYSTNTDATWKIITTSGGVPTTADSGVTPDTDYHIYRIEAFPTGEVHFYIDGVETANSPITTNIPADYLQPQLNVLTRTIAEKQMDVDYVVVRQER